jgi:predicted DNA-binding helix-hairpin-helix protein
MPGAERDQVLRTMQLANRVSINLEAPNSDRLRKLAPLKSFTDELLQPLRWADEIRRTLSPLSAVNLKWPSLATQFVVGSVGESDRELLNISQYLLGKLSLSRIYYSRFEPVRNTPFENLPAEDPLRQVRLYQAGFLLRDYGFNIEDFQYTQNGCLPLETDPKLAWARAHLTQQPLEINTADRLQLLRIPGIGPLGAKRIMKSRYRYQIKEPGELRALGIHVERALPFILINGKRPDLQLRLI